MSINRIVLNNADLKGLSLQIISLDPDGEPILLRYEDTIFFEIFPLNIIQTPQPESYLILIFIEFIRPLLYLFEILQEKIDEIVHIRLVDPLAGRRKDEGIIDRKSKFHGTQGAERQNGYLLIPFL